MRQVLLLLPAITACLALGDGKTNRATKNVFQKQAPPQYQSVAAFNAPAHQQAPTFNAPAPQQAPTFNAPAPQQAPPSPYSFGYESSGSSRQESSDGSGKVTGSYRVTNEDGSVRLVSYVADDQGFRAEVETDEAGASPEQPADVVVRAKAGAAAPTRYAAPQAAQQAHIEQVRW
ncbi:cuticle protein 7-like [Uloborus diversus]|uniref:cuticle protein 7-like n=1 Tax=Uloborus diversus TaxID=327109 RepID=UPI00240A791A|nr:cuticle protein 7-like [Uloborus diversus]